MITLRRAVLATVVLIAMTLGIASSAVAATKTFTVEVSPRTADAAKSLVYTATITNTVTPQKISLGAVNLTVPDKWDVLATSRGTIDGQVVKLRDMRLGAGESTDVAILVDTSAVAGTWEWAAAGKQANNFNGKGNDFLLDGAGSSLTADVAPSEAQDVACPEESPSVGDDTACRARVTWRGTGPLNADGTPVPNDGPGGPTGVTTTFEVTADIVARPESGENAGTLKVRLPDDQINCDGNSETSPVTTLVDGPSGRSKTLEFLVDAGIDLANPSQGMCFQGPAPFRPFPNPELQFHDGDQPVYDEGEHCGEFGCEEEPEPQVFLGTLDDCTDEESRRFPCTETRANPGGNNLTVVQMPVTYPDPAYRP